MIPFDFEYLRPGSILEAREGYLLMQKNGKHPVYYAGGTEIITYCRTQKIRPGAVIDLKGIPECLELRETDTSFVLGAALSLNEIIERNVFPLLSQVANAIADHTVRNRLTLGGNIAGRLPYREAVLPLLLAETAVQVAGPEGERILPLQDIFHKRILFKDGEFLAQVRIPKSIVSAPTFYRRKTKGSRVDYPIASAVFLENNGQLRMAIGGVCGFPFRDGEMETVLNDPSIPVVERPDKVIAAIPFTVMNNHRASAGYRKLLLERIIKEGLTALGE